MTFDDTNASVSEIPTNRAATAASRPGLIRRTNGAVAVLTLSVLALLVVFAFSIITSTQAPRLPTALLEFDQTTFASGQPITGKVTIQARDAADLTAPLKIEIYARGSTQTEASRLSVLTVSAPRQRLGRAEALVVPFQMPMTAGPGDYVARLTTTVASVDEKNHAEGTIGSGTEFAIRAEAVLLRPAEVEALPLGTSDGAAAGTPLLRVYLAQPLTYDAGLPIFRGYVQNNHSSKLSNVRLEITHADGSVARYPIASTMAPGERVPFEFRETRPDVQWPPRFFFLMTR